MEVNFNKFKTLKDNRLPIIRFLDRWQLLKAKDSFIVKSPLGEIFQFDTKHDAEKFLLKGFYGQLNNAAR